MNSLLEGLTEGDTKTAQAHHHHHHALRNKRSFNNTEDLDDRQPLLEEDSSEEEDEKASTLNKPLSEAAKAFFTLKTQIREDMIFIDRRAGVSVYGVHENKGLGFGQLRRLKQLREVILNLFSLKKYELAFYMIFVFALLFSIMSFGQILFFSVALAIFLWLLASVLIHPQANFYYLKKDIKVNLGSFAKGPYSNFQGATTDIVDVDESFGEDIAAQVLSKNIKPHKVFKAMQGILVRLLVIQRRKRFMPFISKCEVKGQILKLVTEAGESRYFTQHFLKHGKHHFAAVETEKFSGEIYYVYELKLIPKTQNIILSVFMRETDSKSAISAVDALCRELAMGCEEEETIRLASTTAYFKICELIPKLPTKREEVTFEQLKPAEVPETELQPVKEDIIEGTESLEMKILLPQLSPTEGSSRKIGESVSLQDTSEPKTVSSSEPLPLPEKEKEIIAPSLVTPTPNIAEKDIIAISPVGQSEPLPLIVSPSSTVLASVQLKGSQLAHYGLQITPAIPEGVVRLFEEKHKWLENFGNINNGRWRETENKNGLRVFEEKENSGDYIRLISIYRIQQTIEELTPFMKDPAFRLKYDELLKSVDFLVRYSEDIGVVRVVVKGQFPVSDREFITYIAVTRPDEDTLISISYDAPDYEYPKNKAVRGELEMSASILKKTGPNECEFTLVVSSDPKVKGVPNSIIRSKSKQTAMAPVQFYDIIKKERLIKPKK